MIKYNVRSRQLVDILGEVKRKRLILSPFFQRNLVWRTIHKVDFIKTILIGYPFPEIFIAKGDLDIEEMTTTSAVVDGQQRLSSIIEYVSDEYKVDDKYYSELSPEIKENFLKYEIAIIELDIKYTDPEITEIFKRLNRTYYSLSNIEKLSTEYAPSELMLVGKLIAGELSAKDIDKKDAVDFDPLIPNDFLLWARGMEVDSINKLIIASPIFSPYEISRQVHLMFSLNIIGNVISNGFINRNTTKEMLEANANELENKDDIVHKFNEVSKVILKMNLPKASYWYNKANSFTLLTTFYSHFDKVMNMDVKKLKTALKSFENNVPSEYQIAAKEGVNNKKERNIRNEFIVALLNEL